MIPAVYSAIGCLCALLLLVSYVERVYAEMGKFLSREFQENIEAFEKLVEPKLASTSRRAMLAIMVLVQLTTAAIAMLIAYLVFSREPWTALELVQALVAMIVLVIVFNRLLPYMMFTRTRGEWLVKFVPVLKLLIYLMLLTHLR